MHCTAKNLILLMPFCEAIIENALEEHERDFNQTIFYGRDADPLAVVSEAKGFPMMSERRLVVLREAQDMKDIYAARKLLRPAESVYRFCDLP